VLFNPFLRFEKTQKTTFIANRSDYDMPLQMLFLYWIYDNGL